MIRNCSAIISSIVSVIASVGFFVPLGSLVPTVLCAEMRDMTTQEIVREMGIGINLGNTFEAGGDWIYDKKVANFEQSWGSPIVTEEMIKGFKKGGFGVVRVPANWSNMMSDDYTLHPDFIARIQQVVGWIIKNDMYAIVNIHHEGWIADMPTNKDECLKRYVRFWEQISEAFQDYSDYLMLESQNEDGVWEKVWNHHWNNDFGKEEAFSYLNEMNQAFVDVVRKSGGNNPRRHLLIAGYATDVMHTSDKMFKMPKDPAKRCAVSVHYYHPFNFTLLTEKTDWGTPQDTWGSDEDVAELNKYMDVLKTRFVDQGIPVIVGEFGALVNGTRRMKNQYMFTVSEAIYSRKMCPILWDTPRDDPERNYCRRQCKMNNVELMKGFRAIVDKGTKADKRAKIDKLPKSKRNPKTVNQFSVEKGFDEQKNGINYGTVHHVRYYSQTVENDRNVIIILPANVSGKKKYPVLYLLHGLGCNEHQWLGGHPNEVIGNLVAEGKAKEMIVVIPDICARHKNTTKIPEFYSVEHFREYDNFLNDLRDDLMPFVEKNYPVLSGRKNRAVAGLSMGGRSALHVGIELIDEFAAIGAFTPAVGVLPYEVEKGLFTKTSFTVPKKYKKNTLITIVKGSEDTVVGDWPKTYSDTLNENGVEHIYYVTEGDHDFNVWKNGLYHFVQRIFW